MEISVTAYVSIIVILNASFQWAIWTRRTASAWVLGVMTVVVFAYWYRAIGG